MSLTYYFLPTRNVFGEGAVNEAGKLMKSLDGTHPMIVTDAFLAKSGMADQVKKILEDEGLPTYIFGGAEPNPTDKNVVAGVKAFKEQGCDSIISLGGGSSHDCAKAIGLIAANGGEIYDYEGIDISKNKMVPLMSINTTAARLLRSRVSASSRIRAARSRWPSSTGASRRRSQSTTRSS